MEPSGGSGYLTSLERHAPSDAVTGWRYWQLDTAGRVLTSVSHRQVRWLPDEPLRAVCLIGGHQAPAPGCACGVHAHADLGALRGETLCLSPTRPLVAGEVSLWGDVVFDDHGIRGQYAYPGRLLLVTNEAKRQPDTALLELLGAYGVPVGTVDAHEVVGDVAAAVLAFQAMSR